MGGHVVRLLQSKTDGAAGASPVGSRIEAYYPPTMLPGASQSW
jgi:hypothetical protein